MQARLCKMRGIGANALDPIWVHPVNRAAETPSPVYYFTLLKLPTDKAMLRAV